MGIHFVGIQPLLGLWEPAPRGTLEVEPAFIFTTAALGNPVITGDLSEMSTVSSALSLCLTYLPNKGPLLTKEKKNNKSKITTKSCYLLPQNKTTKTTVLDA